MARLVIIDDAAGTRLILKTILEGAGHEVVGQAADGEEGLALVEKLQPTLILVDMLMPRLDGIAFAHRLRERGVLTPVVMVSSVNAVDRIRAAREAGVFHYMLKPFEPAKVIAVVAAALAAKPLGQPSA